MSDAHRRPNAQPLRLLLGIGVLLLMVAAAVLTLYFVVPGTRTLELPSTAGTVLNPPEVIADFTLTNTENAPFGLDDLRGSYSLVSFGYTHCPDVCPLTLSDYRRVQRELGDDADAVNFVFISVDGERDTPELLRRYIQRFDETFIGLTTSDETNMRAIADDFNIYYERREIQGTAATYLVDHTASLFLLNPRGEVIALYSFGTSPVSIAEDIRSLL